MAYQSRRRNYKSRRDKMKRSGQVVRLAILFALIFGVIYVWFNRVRIFDYLETYFY